MYFCFFLLLEVKELLSTVLRNPVFLILRWVPNLMTYAIPIEFSMGLLVFPPLGSEIKVNNHESILMTYAIPIEFSMGLLVFPRLGSEIKVNNHAPIL
jgi:hypothetical protein